MKAPVRIDLTAYPAAALMGSRPTLRPDLDGALGSQLSI